jgi:hypothetical protein
MLWATYDPNVPEGGANSLTDPMFHFDYLQGNRARTLVYAAVLTEKRLRALIDLYRNVTGNHGFLM